MDINNELTNANKKIISLQDKVIDNEIGAGNLPNLIISGPYVDKFYYTLQFGIINKGRTPLRGLSAEITDIYSNTYYNYEKKKYEVRENLDSLILFERVIDLEKKVSIGDIPPNSWRRFYNARLPKISGEVGYRIEIMWDNGRMSFNFSGKIDQEKDHVNMKLTRIADANGKQLSQKLVKFNEFNF